MNYCSFSSDLCFLIYLALGLKRFKKDQYCEIALENVNHANFFHSFSYPRKLPTYTDQPIRVVIWLYISVNSFPCKYSDNFILISFLLRDFLPCNLITLCIEFSSLEDLKVGKV